MDELNDLNKPTNLVDELSELIEKKKAENKLLNNLREAARISTHGPQYPSVSETTTKTVE